VAGELLNGVERLPVPGGACWMCGKTAAFGEKLPGRKHKTRLLCPAHAEATFGAQDPPRRDGQAAALPGGP
jgi:hypothetical protein